MNKQQALEEKRRLQKEIEKLDEIINSNIENSRLNDFVDFQNFNMGTRLPGWKDRLGKTWNNEDYR